MVLAVEFLSLDEFPQPLGIAVHLQRINQPKAVLLPIEQLRTVLKCRKLVVAGAVKRLMKNDLLMEIGAKAHTGKGREFRASRKKAPITSPEMQTAPSQNPSRKGAQRGAVDEPVQRGPFVSDTARWPLFYCT